MTQTTLENTSQSIADYVREHGRDTSRKDEIPSEDMRKHFQVTGILPDGRELQVKYHIVPRDTTPTTSLEIRLRPVKSDQYGCITQEYGLNGEIRDFILLIGTQNSFRLEPFGPSGVQTQQMYEKVKDEVNVALHSEQILSKS